MQTTTSKPLSSASKASAPKILPQDTPRPTRLSDRERRRAETKGSTVRPSANPESAVTEGLKHLTLKQLLSGQAYVLLDAVERKLRAMESIHGKNPPLLTDNARLLVRMVRDSLSDKYPHLSALAFVHFLAALDYLLHLRDETWDTQAGGLQDDHDEITRAINWFQAEVDAYRQWEKANG